MLEPIASPGLDRVRQLSLAFRLFCRACLLLAGLAFISWLAVYLPARSGTGATKNDLYGLAVTVAGMISVAYWVYGLWVMERLFNVLATGRVFEADSGQWLKRLGFWLSTALALPLVSRMAVDWAFFGRLGAIREGPFTPIFAALLAGLFLCMLGWVLEEASRLKAEQDLTV